MTVQAKETASLPQESARWVSLTTEQQKQIQATIRAQEQGKQMQIVPDMLIYNNPTDCKEGNVSRLAVAHAALLWAVVSNDIGARYGACATYTIPTEQGTIFFLSAEKNAAALGREIRGAVPKANGMIKDVGGTKFIPT